MTYPWPTLMPMGIVVISCVRPSVQPSMGLGLCIAYKALGRNVSRWLTLSIHGCLWILLLVCLSVHMSVCSFTAFSGSHYWEMAVAITCGYGGYLLPLLAAHSSFLSVHLTNPYSGHMAEPQHTRRHSPPGRQKSQDFLYLPGADRCEPYRSK